MRHLLNSKQRQDAFSDHNKCAVYKHKGYYGLSGTLEKHLSEVLAEDKGDVHTPPELAEEINIQECSRYPATNCTGKDK